MPRRYLGIHTENDFSAGPQGRSRSITSTERELRSASNIHASAPTLFRSPRGSLKKYLGTPYPQRSICSAPSHKAGQTKVRLSPQKFEKWFANCGRTAKPLAKTSEAHRQEQRSSLPRAAQPWPRAPPVLREPFLPRIGRLVSAARGMDRKHLTWSAIDFKARKKFAIVRKQPSQETPGSWRTQI